MNVDFVRELTADHGIDIDGTNIKDGVLKGNIFSQGTSNFTGTIDITNASIIGLDADDIASGVLTVSKGGTGLSDLTNNTFLVGQGTSAIDTSKIVPSGNVVGTTDSQILVNKTINTSTIDADNNTITNIADSHIKTGAAINATKFADGSVSNTEYQYLNGVTSAIQTQFDTKISIGHAHDAANIISGTFLDSRISESSVVQYTGALEDAINHDALVNFDANKHVDHANVYILSDQGIAIVGGGNIAANVTLELDINSLVVDASPDGAADYVLTYDASMGVHKKVLVNNLVGVGSGESNTGTNVGIAGVGIYKQKNGTVLEFKKINAGSSKITITDDTGNDEIDVDIVESQLVLGNLSGAPVGNVVGISDAQILTNKTIDANNNTITNIENADIKTAAAIDATKIANGSINNAEFQYLDGVTSAIQTQFDDLDHNTLAGYVANQHVNHNDVHILSGEGIDGNGDLTANVMLSLDINSLTANTTPNAATDYVVIFDASAANHKKVLLNNLPHNGEINTASNVGTGGIGVFKQKNGTEFEFKKINAGSSKIVVTDDTGNNEIDLDINQSQISIGALSGAPSGSVVGTTDVQTLTNKTFTDSTTTFQDNGDTSKKMNFQLDEITTSTTRTLTIPDVDDTLTTLAATQTLTNKTINADNNTITNIDNADIKIGAAIDVPKIHDGSVNNIEFGYLDGVTSAIQTQLDDKAPSLHTHTTSDTISGTFVDARISESSITQHQNAIDHNSLTNFVTNNHVDHSTVHILSSQGLTGSGNITANITINLDINSLTANTSPNGAIDYVVVYDTSATTHKKVLIDNLPGGYVQSASNLAGDQGLYVQLNGDTLEFKSLTQGNNIALTSNTDTIIVSATNGITWNGDWISQNYVTNDAVHYSGNTYICTTNTISNENPSNNIYWNLMAQKGDDGDKGLNWQGTWAIGNYIVDDAVYYSSNSYICILDTISNENPSNVTHWDLMAQKGDDGVGGGSVGYHNITATTQTSTTSTSYIQLDSMTYTPASGTYMVTFSSSGWCTNGGANAQYAIYNDEVKDNASERDWYWDGGNHTNNLRLPLHTQAVVTVNGSQSIEIRYMRGSGSGTTYVNERSMVLIKLA